LCSVFRFNTEIAEAVEIAETIFNALTGIQCTHRQEPATHSAAIRRGARDAAVQVELDLGRRLRKIFSALSASSALSVLNADPPAPPAAAVHSRTAPALVLRHRIKP
jgi:hypothetical protein